MGLFASILPAVIGGAFNAFSSWQTNEANIDQSNAMMAFQDKMSRTQHQREVADLRAAGLNPILSATGGSGAAVPSGSKATLENPMKDFTDTMINSAKASGEYYLNKEKTKTEKTNQKVNQALETKLSQEGKAQGLENKVKEVESAFDTSRFGRALMKFKRALSGAGDLAGLGVKAALMSKIGNLGGLVSSAKGLLR